MTAALTDRIVTLIFLKKNIFMAFSWSQQRYYLNMPEKCIPTKENIYKLSSSTNIPN